MVGVVVVTYNRLELLKKNIESLRKQNYRDFKIIIINNGSTDGTNEWLSVQEDLIIITQENLGGAGGFFSGLKYVSENDFEYCWLMDDDVICNTNALEELINAANFLNEQHQWGFICSSVFDKNKLPANTPRIDMQKIYVYPRWSEYLEHSLLRIKNATFVSVFIPVKNIKKLGLPIKDFFIWGDDTEYTSRLSKEFPCYLVGKSIVTHYREMVKGLSFLDETNPNRVKLYFYMYRNQLYIAKHGYWEKPFPIVRYFTSKLIIMLKALVHCKFSHAKIIINAMIKAINFNPKIEYPQNKIKE